MNCVLQGVASRILVVFFALSVSSAAFAADIQAGKHYNIINPPLEKTNPGKIEVVEFFSYGCIHCFNLHPLISAWSAQKPNDVIFRRVHVAFNRPPLARLAKSFYAGEAIGISSKLDEALFRAIHEQRMNFGTDDDLVKFVSQRGFDGKKFADALNGFSMQSQVQRGDQEAAAAKISGTPAIVVDGRFLIINEAARNQTELLKLTDDVIAMARKDKPRK